MPVLAHADTYTSDTLNRDFAGSAGGWTETTETGGSCASLLMCATVANGWNAGGADGNGYIRTQFSSVLATLTGTSTGIWDSPAFVYNGNAGAVPATATFDMNLRSDVVDLLGASINSSSFRVDLVDTVTTNQISVVPSTVLSPNTSWTAIPSASVNPALLTLGSSYKLRISTTFHSTVAVQATGEVGFDNVRLVTTAVPAGPVPGPPGPPGTPATNDDNGGANHGSGITTRRQLRNLTKTYILPATAKLKGNKLRMKLRCPAIASPKPCKIQAQGLSKGKLSKPATGRKIVTIKPGKSKVVLIRVKPKYLAAYLVAKKIWVKTTVRVGSIRVTVRKRVKLKH
jgi:hypothetical protein